MFVQDYQPNGKLSSPSAELWLERLVKLFFRPAMLMRTYMCTYINVDYGMELLEKLDQLHHYCVVLH